MPNYLKVTKPSDTEMLLEIEVEPYVGNRKLSIHSYMCLNTF